MLTATKKSFAYGAHTVTLETGEIARQAHGAVMVNMGETVVLATVVAAKEPKPGQVRVLLDFGGNTELLHLAESITAAELWIAREGAVRRMRTRLSFPTRMPVSGGKGPNLFHQKRTVLSLISMPRSCRRSSTFRSDSGKRM